MHGILVVTTCGIKEVDFMNTEITKGRLTEWFYPTEKFRRYTDNVLVDYAEIEINPDGIKKLEDNLDRCVGNPRDFSENDWKNLHNPNEDIYEHIIAYVHFDAGTDKFNKLFIEVFTSYDDVELETDKLVNEEEKHNIIEAALESLHKHRGTVNMKHGW